ncbi:hypothetical protein FRC01_011412, partial [Tulasnella sp. 417]
ANSPTHNSNSRRSRKSRTSLLARRKRCNLRLTSMPYHTGTTSSTAGEPIRERTPFASEGRLLRLRARRRLKLKRPLNGMGC